MSQNPLLNLDGLIDFAAIRPEHVAPAIRELIAEAQKTLDAVTKPEVPAPRLSPRRHSVYPAPGVP